MNWISWSIVSCVLFGFTGILISGASAVSQASRMVFFYYSLSLFFSAVLFRIYGTDNQVGPIQRNEVLCAFGAGLLGALAIIIQVFCFGKYPDKGQWIILICCMNPVIVTGYAILIKGNQLTSRQVVAFILAVIAIALLTLPEGASRPK